jgi:hypothetical protein
MRNDGLGRRGLDPGELRLPSADHVDLLELDIACDIKFQVRCMLLKCRRSVVVAQLDQDLANGAAVGDVP